MNETTNFPDGARLLLRGEVALWGTSGGKIGRLWMMAGDHLWNLCLGTDGALQWAQRHARAEAERMLPTAGDAFDRFYPVHEVPSGFGDRLLVAARHVEELQARYLAGDCWVPEGEAFLVLHPVLGSIRVAPKYGSLSSRPYPCSELFSWVWQHAAGFPERPPAAALAAVQPAMDRAAGWVEGLRGGGQLLRLDATTCILEHGDVFFRLSALDPAAFDELLFNPHAQIFPLHRLVDEVAASWRHPTLEPTPSALLALLGRLDEELRRPHAEILDRYLDKIRHGGTFSAGPTTDQTWTVRHTGEGFVVDWYRPMEEGYERVTDPIDEATLRRRIAPMAKLEG
jgi:hypothetical protein